jgi:transposase
MQYKPRKRYSEAFRQDAVRQSIETHGTLRELAGRLDVHEGMLQRWRKKYLNANGRSIDILKKTQSPEKSYKALEQENRRLRKALEQAKIEADILKKAQEYFAAQRGKNSNS